MENIQVLLNITLKEQVQVKKKACSLHSIIMAPYIPCHTKPNFI